MRESTKVTEKQERENTVAYYFTLGSENMASSSKSASESEETGKFGRLPANTNRKQCV